MDYAERLRAPSLRVRNARCMALVYQLKRIEEAVGPCFDAFVETARRAARVRVSAEDKGSAAQASNNFAGILQEQGNLPQAEWFYRRSIELDPRAPRLWTNLGINLQVQRRHTEALDALRHSLSINPDDVSAQANLGVMLSHLGQSGSALNALLIAQKLHPGRAHTLRNLGIVLVRSRRLDEAVNILKKAVAVEPTELNNYLALATAQIDQGSLGEAVATLEHAKNMGLTSGTLLASLAAGYHRTADFEKAIAIARTAVSIEPLQSHPLQQLGAFANVSREI